MQNRISKFVKFQNLRDSKIGFQNAGNSITKFRNPFFKNPESYFELWENLKMDLKIQKKKKKLEPDFENC